MDPDASPAELRARLAELLAKKAGLEPHQVAARREAARQDPELVEAVLTALIDGGGYLHEEVGSRRVRLEELEELPIGPELLVVLDRRKVRPLQPVQQARLARLYALAGEVEKSAACYREVLAGPEPLPLALTVELAATAARAGAVAIALAGVDRVAEVVLTRDQGEGPPLAGDPLRDDPLGAGALLERARDIALAVGQAPRAVALGRAASALYERLGRRAEARHSLSGQARALRAAGNAKKARQQLERWRELARDAGATSDEAAAVEALAEHEALGGQVQAASTLLGEAAQLLQEAGDVATGLHLLRRRAQLLGDEGALERAAEVLEDAVARAGAAELPALAADLGLELVRVQLSRGWLARAITGAEALFQACQARGDAAREGAAAVLLAQGLFWAGDAPRALKALGRLPAELDLGPLSGRSLRLRAELAAQRGQGPEAGLLLLDAARALRPLVPAEAVEALLRRAELCLELGQVEAAREERRRVGALGVPAALELRHELLAARLADEEERELLLEELWEGSGSATLPDRLRVAVALARLRLDAGDRAAGVAPLSDALDELREVRDGLDGRLRRGFARSPLLAAPLELVKELRGADATLDELARALEEGDQPGPEAEG